MELSSDISLYMLLATLAVIICSAIVHGALGLGFPLIATPILAVMFDVRSAIVLTLIPTAAVNITTIIKSGNVAETLRRFWPLALAGVVGAALASSLLARTDPEPYRLVLAAAIIVYLLVSQFGANAFAWVRRYELLAMAVFGFLAGVANGLTNVMVAVLLIFVLEMRLERLQTVAVLNVCFVLGKLTQIGVLANAGFVTPYLLMTTAPLAVVAVLMLLFGMRFRDAIPVDMWRNVLRVLLSVLAAVLVWQFVR